MPARWRYRRVGLGITVISEGNAGEILVEDEREDGSVVFLVCRPWNASNGILVAPNTPSDLDGEFPLLESVRRRGLLPAARPFRITIDTTKLRAGPLAFQSEAFIAAAGRAARDGVDRVVLDDVTAEAWGLEEEPLGR